MNLFQNGYSKRNEDYLNNNFRKSTKQAIEQSRQNKQKLSLQITQKQEAQTSTITDVLANLNQSLEQIEAVKNQKAKQMHDILEQEKLIVSQIEEQKRQMAIQQQHYQEEERKSQD